MGHRRGELERRDEKNWGRISNALDPSRLVEVRERRQNKIVL